MLQRRSNRRQSKTDHREVAKHYISIDEDPEYIEKLFIDDFIGKSIYCYFKYFWHYGVLF